MEKTILINKVAAKPIVTVDLAHYFPTEKELAVVDLKDYLWQGLILREAEFRTAVSEQNWKDFEGKFVNIVCSADAIVPLWAYMILTAELVPYAKNIFAVHPDLFFEEVLKNKIFELDKTNFEGKRIILKGCGEKKLSPAIYSAITQFLTPLARSIAFGEACSSVPVFKTI